MKWYIQICFKIIQWGEVNRYMIEHELGIQYPILFLYRLESFHNKKFKNKPNNQNPSTRSGSNQKLFNQWFMFCDMYHSKQLGIKSNRVRFGPCILGQKNNCRSFSRDYDAPWTKCCPNTAHNHCPVTLAQWFSVLAAYHNLLVIVRP